MTILRRLLMTGAAVLALGAGCIQVGSSGAGPTGVWRSADQGDSWQPVAALPSPEGVRTLAGAAVYRLWPDPADANSWYMGTRGQGLFYTYNNGDSWQEAEALRSKFIYGLAINPQEKCIIYATDGSSIYKTSDCNRTWESVYTEVRPTDRVVGLAIDDRAPNVLYASKYGGDLIKSTDHGASWRVIHRFQTEIMDVAISPLAPDRLYVAARTQGLFRSNDSGATWANVSTGLGEFTGSKQFYRLVTHPSLPNSVFWISKYGILRSDDAGDTWSHVQLLSPPGTVNIYAFAVNPKNDQEMYYTATVLGDKNQHVRSTFYKTSDGGGRWVTRRLPTNTVPVSMFVHRAKPTGLFLGFTPGN